MLLKSIVFIARSYHQFMKCEKWQMDINAINAF